MPNIYSYHSQKHNGGNKTTMASSAETKRKAIIHDQGQSGLTLYYMTKEELQGAVQSGTNLLHGWKNIAAKGAALSNENDCQSTELECRVRETLRTQPFNPGTQFEVVEDRPRKENENAIAQQAENQALKQSMEAAEESIRVFKQQLGEWKENHASLEGELEELRKSSSSDIKLLNEEICSLKEEREDSEREHRKQQESSKVARDELEARHAALQVDFELLTVEARKSKQSIDALEKAAEKCKQVRKEQREASNLAHSELELKHTSLQGKYRDLQTAAELADEEIFSLKKEREISEREHNIARDELETNSKSLQADVESLKAEVRKSKESVDALDKAAEESERVYKEQQKASKLAHAELKSKLKTLEEKCRDLETSAMHKSEEVKSLKEEKRTLKADIDVAIQEHTEKINSLERAYAKQLATANETVKSLEEEATKRDELHKQEKTILADENDGLQSEVKGLLLKVQSMEVKIEEGPILKVQPTEVKIEELNKEIRAKSMANENLNQQLANCLKIKNATHERVTFLEKEVEQKFNSSLGTEPDTKEGNESCVDLLSSSNDEGDCQRGIQPAGVKPFVTNSANAPTARPSKRFVPLSLGVNAAVKEKVLQGMTFVLTGAFEEVEGPKSKVDKTISKMVESFGGKVNARLSKNTTHLLAGKDTPGDKFKEASKRKLTVISLRRLEQLLLGRMTVDELAKLETLTKDSFKEEAYQSAGAVTS